MDPRNQDEAIEQSVHQLTSELSPLQRLFILEALSSVLRLTEFTQEEWEEFSKNGQVPRKVLLQLSINLARDLIEAGRNCEQSGTEIRTLGWALNLAEASEILEWLRKSDKKEESLRKVVEMLMNLRDELYPDF